MADIVTFDPMNLRIVEINSGKAVNSLSLAEIYSEWKDWLLADMSRAGYPAAFRVVGGDPISDSQNLGITYFLNTGDGWRIRPAEYDHVMEIEGNLFTDPAGDPTIAPTLGAYTVVAQQRVSNLTDASVARLDLAQLLEGVYIDTIGGQPGTGIDSGTPTNPVNNLTDARTIADARNLRSYVLRGAIILDQAHEDWNFSSIGAEHTAVIELNGQSVDGSFFDGVELRGSALTSKADGELCTLDVLSGLYGEFLSCRLISTFTLPDNTHTDFANCYSGIPGNARPEVYFGTNSTAGFRSYSGGLELFGMTAGCTVSVDMAPSTVFLGPTNTGGAATLRGTGKVNDTSAGTVVDNQAIALDDVETATRTAEDWGAINFSK